MASSAHPSARSRLSTPAIALEFAKHKIAGILPARQMGGQFGNLSSRRPGAFHPARPGLSLGDPDVGAAILAGKFDYAGQTLDIGVQGNPWTTPAPSRGYADWLHSFSWLPDLLANEGEAAELRACALVDGWLETYGKGNDFAWESDRLARRLFYWLSLWSPGLSRSEGETQIERRRLGAVRQLAALKSTLGKLSPGLARFYAGCALAMGGARITDAGGMGRTQYLERGLDFLDTEITLQILPDGGHISRSPAQTAKALRLLLTLDTLLADRGVEGSREISRAIDRLAPMLAFFQRSTGELAPFHGGGEIARGDVTELLRVAPGEPKPFGYCPHTGYQRLAADGQILLIDTGSSPPRPFDLMTHLAPLAIDLSTQDGPMITSCGFNAQQPDSWQRPVRAAAAHSTLVLDGRSPGRLLMSDWKRATIGDAVDCAAGPVKASRKEQDSGIWLESHHEGYMGDYGLSHRRRLFMPKDGEDIRGEDSLFVPLGATPLRRDQVPFAIRFHMHPNVRVSLSQDQSSALLVVGGKTGWRFRTDGGPLSIEDSVYLGTGTTPIKTQQIVIRGDAFCDSDGETRSNRVRWSFRRLKLRDNKAKVET